MNRAKDISGRKFGRLTVLRRAGTYSDGSASWLCRCECGAKRVVVSGDLHRGRTRSCRNCRDPLEGSWTSAEESRLRELYPTMELEELARELPGRTIKAIRSRAKILRVQRKTSRRPWTAQDLRQLRKLYSDTSTKEIARLLGRTITMTYQKARKLGLSKSEAYMASPAACRLRRGDNVGAAFRFRKGQVPQNKGMRRPGWSAGRMRETQFRKGQQPRNTMPMWSFRFCDGYLMLKTGAPTPKPTTGWEYVHKLIWEQAHGPLPSWREARLWWKDGDHSNCSLSNLELVSAEEHMRRTTVHNLPTPLPQLIQLAGALKRKIRTKEKKLHGQEYVAGSAGPSLRDAGSAV